MDIKTLEYLEERARKGREIVRKIEEFNQQINALEKVDRVIFNRINSGSAFHLDSKESLEYIKSAYIEYAQAKIKELGQRLAEL